MPLSRRASAQRVKPWSEPLQASEPRDMSATVHRMTELRDTSKAPPLIDVYRGSKLGKGASTVNKNLLRERWSSSNKKLCFSKEPPAAVLTLTTDD